MTTRDLVVVVVVVMRVSCHQGVYHLGVDLILQVVSECQQLLTVSWDSNLHKVVLLMQVETQQE